MTPEEYQSLCFRTVSTPLHFWKLPEIEREESHHRLLLNTTLGMAGEAAEITTDLTSNECGDAYWYAYVFMRCIDMAPFPPKKERAESPSQASLLFHAGIICEWVKKYIFHKKPFELCKEVWDKEIVHYIDTVAALDPQAYEVTFSQNINKLKERYPDGFRTYDENKSE